LIDAFNERWGDKKEYRHLLAALHGIKKSENETMEEFNKKFNELVSSLHTDIKPPTASILIYYIEAFNSEMGYQLRDKEPTNLKISQEMAINIDRNVQASGKSNLSGFTRGNTSKQQEPKDKTVASDSKASSSDPLKELTEMKELVNSMEQIHVAQLNAMQTRLISMERSQVNRFKPRQNNEKWKNKGPPQDHRPPNQLEVMNVVQQETPPFCRACEAFHEESTCLVFCQINQQGFLGSNNYVGFSGRPDFINNTYNVTKDQSNQNKELS